MPTASWRPRPRDDHGTTTGRPRDDHGTTRTLVLARRPAAGEQWRGGAAGCRLRCVVSPPLQQECIVHVHRALCSVCSRSADQAALSLSHHALRKRPGHVLNSAILCEPINTHVVHTWRRPPTPTPPSPRCSNRTHCEGCVRPGRRGGC